jgi:DNA-directed RNA polymerase subunit E'/Rpb7
VHISAIPGDYWELEAGGMGLVGRRTGRRWQMGDAVRVRLSRVDLTQRQIDFELLDGEGGTAHGTGTAAARSWRARRWPAIVGRRRSAGAVRRSSGGGSSWWQVERGGGRTWREPDAWLTRRWR